MNNFPTWANDWLEQKSGQVSHGLNLVLPLDPAPNRMPQLLWDIVLAQDKIKAALKDLSFIHYARVIPSWDGRALMVTTEFDGPLDPYVLDFVIALGDVFDMLLSYVKTEPMPPRPVRSDPDAFLAWVKKWNRVPFYLREVGTEGVFFPESYDYPVFSAYPTLTVTDITGPRTEPPPPALDHPAANVDRSDVQGNILKGYRAKHVDYLMYSVTNPTVACNWLAREFLSAEAPWLGLTTAEPWGKEPFVMTQIGITCEGLKRLLKPSRQNDWKLFPDAFQDGAAVRADGNFDRGSSAPDKWLFGGGGVHADVVIILYTKELERSPEYLAALAALQADATTPGLHCLCEFAGDPLDDTVSFGFADGISDPSISGQWPNHDPAAGPDFQPSASPGEFLLHRDYVGMYGGSSLGNMPQGLAGNGSFGVLRLMEADEDLFNSTIADQACALGGYPEEKLKAKMMGRWRDGTPVTLMQTQPPVGGAKPVNNFDYAPSWEFPDSPNSTQDHQGLRCPVGAHIRRANPRSARVAGQAHSRRILRRGMPVKWDEPDGTTRTGLMGLFMGANIEQQFEFIQRQWLNGDQAASGIRGTICPITGNRSEPGEFRFVDPDFNQGRPLVAKIPQLVTTRGCLYLFVPGIAALKGLNADAAPTEVIGGLVKRVEDKAKEEVGKFIHGGIAAAAEIVEKGAAAIGDLISHLGHAAAGTAGVISESADKLSSLLEVDGRLSGEAQAELDRFLSVLHPQTLEGGGDWGSLIRDLLNRNLDSPWVKTIADAFTGKKVLVTPPDASLQDSIDLSQASFRADPFPVLKELREAQAKSIVWVAEQQAYWVLGFTDCQSLLNNDANFVQARGSGDTFKGIVTLDGDKHKEVRDAFGAAFMAALSDKFTEELLPKIVLDVISSVKAQTYLLQFDFMSQYAHPVARTAIWTFLGIDSLDERVALDHLADRMVQSYGLGGKGNGVGTAIFADAALRLAGRLSVPLGEAWTLSFFPGSPYEGQLIGELAARMNPIPTPTRPLGFIETLITLLQTVTASQSPHFLLGSAALHLLQPREDGSLPWQDLVRKIGTADFDAAVTAALEETRRCEPPLSMLQRFAKGGQRICGIDVPDGCQVNAMVASANRDSRNFGQQPEDFQRDRPEARNHLSLGHGVHECAGKLLQEALTQAALTEALKAWPDLVLSNPTAKPAWQASIYFRVLQALSVAHPLPR